MFDCAHCGFTNEKVFPTADIFEGIRLKNFTTVGVGGTARYAAFPVTAEQCVALLECAKHNGIATAVLGCGSNAVISDLGFDGLVIFTRRLCGITESNGTVRAEAGVSLGALVRYYLAKGYGGAEFLCGIPASVGGAVTMNAGAFGRNIADFMINATVFADNKISVIDCKDCGFDYRKSNFQNGKAVVLAAEFKTFTDKYAADKYREYSSKRQLRQPSGKSFGSVFKNPAGLFAGELIERAGLKGYVCGGAAVSEKHANFIINTGGATARDIRNLVKYIKERVNLLFGITLDEEVCYMGDWIETDC